MRSTTVKQNGLEFRVQALEAEVARINSLLGDKARQVEDGDPWARMRGAFADDPQFEEVMRLGKEWRESFRPKTRKHKKPKSLARRKT